MKGLKLKYEHLASAIESTEYDANNHIESIENIKKRLSYLVGKLEDVKQSLPYAEAGSEEEYAIGDIQNLLGTIYFYTQF